MKKEKVNGRDVPLGKRGVSDHIISEQIVHPKCWQKMNLFAGEE